MKYILIISLFITTLISASINESLLKIHATIVPKISLMDFDFEKKLLENKITISIYYEKKDYKYALAFEKMVLAKYANGIKGHLIKSNLREYNSKIYTPSNIVYLLPTKKEKIRSIIKKCKLSKALTFAYSKDDLKNDVMLSLNIGSNVKPIINLEAIKENEITLRPILLKISQRYVDED